MTLGPGDLQMLASHLGDGAHLGGSDAGGSGIFHGPI
jgi:hypothetical protein